MSLRPCQIPQNGVLRRLFRPARFSLFLSFSRTAASVSAPTTSRTMRSRVFGTNFRVSTISSIKLSSRRTFVGFMVLPLSLLAVYGITSIDSQNNQNQPRGCLRQFLTRARCAKSTGWSGPVLIHHHPAPACVFNKLDDGTGYFSKSHVFFLMKVDRESKI